MKFFRKYIFPALYGLLIYFTVRLLHDTVIGERFWKRDWALNEFEMACSILVGYLGIALFDRLFRFYDRRWPVQFCYQGVVRELLIMVGANLLLMNAILTPMAAFTDDGLSLADIVDINVVPTLYVIVYYGIARTSTYLKAYVDNKVQLEKVTNEHLQTELKFLKAQYHPHFLFNALNTIYFQMDEDHEGAKRSIEKFSELLRYQLYDQQQQVPVMQEIEYLQTFIELQKIRSTDKLKLNVDFDKKLNGQLVYPLLFLPLVENAFKYVGGKYHLDIKAKIEDEDIVFRVENSVPNIKPVSTQTSGIGLENLRRRLDLLYPGKHSLVTENENGGFKAEMKIQYGH
ncbi:sensor histidine kinase [Mucilaginibacter ginsenosidivorans]|uniref:Histidine kinase n=1 Tax=Mucilaginibacter ginsenosidivorans TaxID=398053 RepID=A0A5B8UXQ8_9SPHI|nr:histidine kinase [Mucilaginibacter ginsenosidivorans]QEC63465.1 histidine kinase [Mucilaginibacter ginsenosidivorans]